MKCHEPPFITCVYSNRGPYSWVFFRGWGEGSSWLLLLNFISLIFCGRSVDGFNWISCLNFSVNVVAGGHWTPSFYRTVHAFFNKSSARFCLPSAMKWHNRPPRQGTSIVIEMVSHKATRNVFIMVKVHWPFQYFNKISANIQGSNEFFYFLI